MEKLDAYRTLPTLKQLLVSKIPTSDYDCLRKIYLNRKYLSLVKIHDYDKYTFDKKKDLSYVFNIKGTFFYAIIYYLPWLQCNCSEYHANIELYYIKDFSKIDYSFSIGGVGTANEYNLIKEQKLAEKTLIYIEKHYLNNK